MMINCVLLYLKLLYIDNTNINYYVLIFLLIRYSLLNLVCSFCQLDILLLCYTYLRTLY